MKHSERIASIDVLRGAALFGILMMNIQSFAMPHVAYLNPRAWGSLDGLDGVAWSVGRLLFDFKFISLFSMLFGASLVLAGEASNPRRRLAWLVVFGLLHGYLIWYGDILFTYGVVGFFVLPARSWTVRRQLIVGAGLLLVSSLLPLVGYIFWDALPPFILDDLRAHYGASSALQEVHAFRGSWLTQLAVRAPLTFSNHVSGTLFESGWRAAGCMLLGMAGIRLRLFEGTRTRWTWVAYTVCPGLLLTGWALWLQWTTNFALRPWLLVQSLHELGSIGVAIGLGLSIVTLARRFERSTFVLAMARLGRVALTAYLMQSALGSVVFGGHGFALFATWSRTTLFAAAVGIWVMQLGLAWWWTSYFSVGPVEALWRGLTRGAFPTLRNKASN